MIDFHHSRDEKSNPRNQDLDAEIISLIFPALANHISSDGSI